MAWRRSAIRVCGPVPRHAGRHVPHSVPYPPLQALRCGVAVPVAPRALHFHAAAVQRRHRDAVRVRRHRRVLRAVETQGNASLQRVDAARGVALGSGNGTDQVIVCGTMLPWNHCDFSSDDSECVVCIDSWYHYWCVALTSVLSRCWDDVMLLLWWCAQWAIGCVLFSLGVSVKMNALLFAPALLLLLLRNLGAAKTVAHLALCGGVQVWVPVAHLTDFSTGTLHIPSLPCAIPGATGPTIPVDVPLELRVKSIRVLTGVPAQVDCELEILA